MSEPEVKIIAASLAKEGTTPVVSTRRGRRSILARNSSEARLAILLAGLVVLFLVVIGRKFIGRDNLESMATQLPVMGILSLAMMVSLLHGGVNLSIISTANVSALTTAYILTTEASGASGFMWVAWIIIAITAGFAVSIVVGLLNGVVIAYIGVSPILTTLGTMILLQGLAIGVTHGSIISGFPAPIQFIGSGTVLGIPFAMFLLIASLLATVIILNRTPFGASIYLMGSNEKATEYSGVNTHAMILGIYVMSSLLSALAGLVMLSQFNSASAANGQSYLLVSVLAAILGGTDPYGGFGKVRGLVLSILILQVVASAFNQMEMSQFLTLSMWGMILIVVSVVTYLQSYRTTR
jgi:simple sugar transport system permease protein